MLTKLHNTKRAKLSLLRFFVGNVMKAQPGLDAGAVNKAVAAALTSGPK